MASYHWGNKRLGPVVAKNPAKLFEGKEYDDITETRPEVAYQLFLLDTVLKAHVKELAENKQYVSNLAKHMKHTLLALVMRTLQSVNAPIGSEEFTKIIDEEMGSATSKWRKFISRAIECIWHAYRMEDQRYRRREKQPLSAVNFFKSRSYVTKIFPSTQSRTLKAAASGVLRGERPIAFPTRKTAERSPRRNARVPGHALSPPAHAL
jgi:hypothetical protein